MDDDHANRSFRSLYAMFSHLRLQWGSNDTPNAGLVSSQLSTWIFVMAQTAKTAYGVGIHTVFSIQGCRRALEWWHCCSACLCKAFSPSCCCWLNPDNNRGKKWKNQPPHPRSPCRTYGLAYTFRSCRFESAEGSQAEDFPLTGEESLARLSLSLGVKAVTDPNAYTVVAAFQFLITAWLVRLNEGSRVRMINIPIMRTSQAVDDFLF